MKKLFPCLILMIFLFSACGCEHSMISADCTQAAVCRFCGRTEGYPMGHDWLSADCGNPETCSRCGKTSGDRLDHRWKDATQSSPKTCSRCGATEGEPLESESEAIGFDDLYDELLSWAKNKLGSKTEFFYDEQERIIYVSVPAKKGTATAIINGSGEVSEYLDNKCELICDVSSRLCEKFAAEGYIVDCCVMLLNDLNTDNLLLSAYNGEINYDVRDN